VPAPNAATVTSLRVEPSEVELEAWTGEPASVSFSAIATYGDGTEGALDLVSWTLSNASIGTISSRGEYVSVDTNGGDATITATHLDQSATAALSLRYRENLYEGDLDAEVAAAFEAAEDEAGEGIELVYPLDGTAVPRNLAGLVVAWEGMSEGEVARVRFASERTDVSVYTSSSSWEVPTDLWQTITATNSGGSVDVQVTVGDWSGSSLDDVRASSPVSVSVNRLDATGSVTYWSLADERIMRVPAGSTEAAPFFPTDESTECFGCHAISEERQWMVVTHYGVDGQYTVLDVSNPDNPEIIYWLDGSKRMTMRAISPDGNWMAGVLRGAMQLYDLPTNTLVDLPALDGAKYTHPNWSPGGDELVAVRVLDAARFVDDMNFHDGEIVKIGWNGTELTDVEVLVELQPGYNLYYPEFSPDGEWVVFNRSTGDSTSDDDAELFIVPAGGGTPIRLDNANGTGALGNSWARWAPLSDGDLLWFGFSSLRSYPVEGTSNPQIWVTSIDPEKAREGEDPSTTPYWLPGQDPASDNHVPLWWSR